MRAGQIALFVIASREEADLRRSVIGLAISTAIGVGLILGSSFLDAWAQGAVWVVAILLDVGGPYFFGAEGWKLVPEHFAERHGLIMIIALGESIVAIGAGAEAALTFGIAAAAVFGIALAAAQWWAYFDVVALVAARRLARAEPGREQNEIARDSYSYLHLPMVAGIVLVALGAEEDARRRRRAAEDRAGVRAGRRAGALPARPRRLPLRNIHTLNRQRLILAVVYIALLPLVVELDALIAMAIATVLFCALIAYETIRFSEARERIRQSSPRPRAERWDARRSRRFLADHVGRRLVVAQALVGGVAQGAGVGPLGELDLGDELGLDEDRALLRLAALERARLVSQRLEPLAQQPQVRVAEAGADLAGVAQLRRRS